MEKEKLRIIADRIKAIRKKRGYTQESAAEALGMAHNSYIKIENAYYCPSIELLIQMSELYHVSIDLLLTGENKNIIVDHAKLAKLSELTALYEMGTFDKTIEYLKMSKKLLEKANDSTGDEM